MKQSPSSALARNSDTPCPACGVDKRATQRQINELLAALELCLACDRKLTWEAEQEASVLCRRMRLVV